ncbi:TRAP transporter large permease subunit [bacterium]|nr:MAG: TRAP transporter large permease subunit [bacterium]
MFRGVAGQLTHPQIVDDQEWNLADTSFYVYGLAGAPIAVDIGIDSLHYGIALVIAMGIDFFSQPVGIGSYITYATSGISVEQPARKTIPTSSCCVPVCC